MRGAREGVLQPSLTPSVWPPRQTVACMEGEGKGKGIQAGVGGGVDGGGEGNECMLSLPKLRIVCAHQAV